ncbi:hypothetical protein B0A50_03933 [Salinomyces thailandicus]|uniref:L domain-like protein n=1 Tax=Salinomyces thailandicus TaxID=706561 RepID=A0A4U0U257_9PEZI|nr:hypothetical protein B0A50_03933 [Salinomyces thailandica]
MENQRATPSKPSGLPRPASRLPVLNKTSSQVFAKPAEAVIEPPKPSVAPPLQKRPSLAALPRAKPSSLRGSADAPASSTATNSRASAYGSVRGNFRAHITRPSSRANQQREPAPASAKPKAARNEDEENQDQLGSLNGFRAASRQGLYDDDASPVECQEPEQPADEDLYKPRARTHSRPSLSDRTIGSLQAVPTTPKDRRRSSFFSPIESPMGPPPRPASSLSRDGSGSNSSRPGTSDGTFARPAVGGRSPAKNAPASARPSSKVPTTPGGFGFPSMSNKRRSASTAVMTRMQASSERKFTAERSPSPMKRVQPTTTMKGANKNETHRPVSNTRPMAGSKTMAARSSKPRPGLGDVFAPKSAKPASTAPRASFAATNGSPDAKGVTPNPANSSSTALRQQIAAAKAAARREKEKLNTDMQQPSESASLDTFNTAQHTDPFNTAPRDDKHVLKQRIKIAWTSGKLNIAGLSLNDVPDEVVGMYESKAMTEAKVNWAEVVDLTRLILADNELTQLPDTVFPDKSPEELADDEESQGNPFGGLEVLDTHGNHFEALPMGLRRLERLTSLNLSHNALDNSCFGIISQIPSLRELKVGHNNLTGNLPSSICTGLPHLESLDVQANKLLGLPEAIRELTSLRVLNVAGNQLTSLPMEALEEVPLTELDASGNALIASLFPLSNSSRHSTLQTLRVANNSLAALTFSETLELPKLKTLDVTNNHLTGLPDLTGWTELLSLLAADNKISTLPSGFVALRKLRSVNFTSNELRTIDPQVARMEALETFILASNPLRERKLLTMNAADVKRDLRARLEPEDGETDGEPSDPETVIGISDLAPRSAGTIWKVKGNGVLDLSSQGLSDDANDALASFLEENEVKELYLQSNKLTIVPPALQLGQALRVLDLSNNCLEPDYFCDELELPNLRELSLSACRLIDSAPLTTQLLAPRLQTLNLTTNRLFGPLPAFRTTLPALTTFLAKDNKFTSLSADSLRGLQTVNLASNDICALPAEIGMLWEEGLKNFEVGSNAFRVPSYRVLEKGTEAVLRWLRDRLPADQGDGIAG